MKQNTVRVVPYNKYWPLVFNQESALIGDILGNNCIILHHVGSTSVPGLAAKPIIDIVPVVRDISLIERAVHLMEGLGYEYKGEYGIPCRRFFKKEGFNLHIFEYGNSEIERYLNFRDWLVAHPEDSRAYGRLKQSLASQFSDDIISYTIAKTAFIHDIFHKCGINRLRMVYACTEEEWEKVSYFRDKYFFSPNGIEDPYKWTFSHENHKHLALYKNKEIIGYVHVQLWPERRAAIRIMAIEENVRSQNYGSQFLSLCEKWLIDLGYKSIHAESTSKALKFYKNNGYNEMPFNDPEGYESSPEDIAVGKMLD